MSDEEGGHGGLVQADADAIAGDAGLGDFKEGSANAIAVADADFVVGETVDGEVLAELAKGEVLAAQVLLPVAIGGGLVEHDGAVLSAMAEQVALAVAIDVEAADQAWSWDGTLPDGGAKGLASPSDVTREADIDGNEAGHGSAPFGLGLGMGDGGPSP